MKDYDGVIAELEKIITSKTKIDVSSVDPDLNLEESGLDSFARIELVLMIEERFGFELSDAEAAALTTVDDVVRIILARQTVSA